MKEVSVIVAFMLSAFCAISGILALHAYKDHLLFKESFYLKIAAAFAALCAMCLVLAVAILWQVM